MRLIISLTLAFILGISCVNPVTASPTDNTTVVTQSVSGTTTFYLRQANPVALVQSVRAAEYWMFMIQSGLVGGVAKTDTPIDARPLQYSRLGPDGIPIHSVSLLQMDGHGGWVCSGSGRCPDRFKHH